MFATVYIDSKEKAKFEQLEVSGAEEESLICLHIFFENKFRRKYD